MMHLNFILYRVSKKNAWNLQSHIFKNTKFDVFKFFTVIMNELKWCIERFDLITSPQSNFVGFKNWQFFSPVITPKITSKIDFDITACTRTF